MIVSILQLMGFPMGKPVHSRAEQTPVVQSTGTHADKSVIPEQAQANSARRHEVKAKSGKELKVKAAAKTSAKTPPKAPSKTSAKAHAKPAAKPVAKAPVKAAAKAVVKAVPKPVAKAPAKKAAPAAPKAATKVVPKATAKATAKPVAKAAPKPAPAKAPAKKAAPAPKPVVKPAAKSTAKPVVPAKAKPAATPPAKAAPKPVAKAPAPAPATAKVAVAPKSNPAPVVPAKPAAAPVVQKSGRPSSRLAQLTVPSMAQTVASTAAKASYTQSIPSPVIVPALPSSIKKDPKLANNWKIKPVAELTDADLMAMPDAEYMNDVQMAAFRLKLSRLKQDILNNAGETTEHLREDTSVVPDPADRATIEEEHALELRTRDRERKLLKKIEQSIARIDAGDYGYCDETGEPIGVGRLLARPTATLSLEAQQRRELKQKMFGD
jgi:DnaK suppressor protein